LLISGRIVAALDFRTLSFIGQTDRPRQMRCIATHKHVCFLRFYLSNLVLVFCRYCVRK